MLKIILQFHDYTGEVAYIHNLEYFYRLDTGALELERLYSDMTGYSGDIIDELASAIENDVTIVIQDQQELIPLLAFDYSELEKKPTSENVKKVLEYFNISQFEFYEMVDNMS